MFLDGTEDRYLQNSIVQLWIDYKVDMTIIGHTLIMLFFAIGGSKELPKLEDMEAILDNMVEDTMDIRSTMDITAIMAITVTLVTIKVIILITDPIFTTVAADILEMVVDFITGRNKKS